MAPIAVNSSEWSDSKRRSRHTGGHTGGVTWLVTGYGVDPIAIGHRASVTSAPLPCYPAPRRTLKGHTFGRCVTGRRQCSTRNVRPERRTASYRSSRGSVPSATIDRLRQAATPKVAVIDPQGPGQRKSKRFRRCSTAHPNPKAGHRVGVTIGDHPPIWGGPQLTFDQRACVARPGEPGRSVVLSSDVHICVVGVWQHPTSPPASPDAPL
jgi:hypothetical protein